MGSAVICGHKDKAFVATPGQKNPHFDAFSTLEDLIFTDESNNRSDQTVLELFLKCTNLQSDSRFQLLNPLATISIEKNSVFIYKDETEAIISTLNPVFQKTFRIIFSLKYDFNLKFDICEQDGKKNKISLGSCVFSLHELASCGDFISADLLSGGKKVGTISVLAKELKFLNDVVIMDWEFLPLSPSARYYFLRISRKHGIGFVPVYQTETKNIKYSKKLCRLGKNCDDDQ